MPTLGAMPTLVLQRGHVTGGQAWPQRSTAVAMAPAYLDVTEYKARKKPQSRSAIVALCKLHRMVARPLCFVTLDAVTGRLESQAL
jgi:hypothetical protein